MRTIAYCGGTFDCFHFGHVRFFKWVKENFDFVVVALNPDSFVRKYKGETVQTYEERKEVLLACRYVDQVIENTGGEDSKPSIIKHRPTHIINGSDWTRERLMVQMGLTEEFLEYHKLTIVLCPLPRQFSTTELKQRIRTQK